MFCSTSNFYINEAIFVMCNWEIGHKANQRYLVSNSRAEFRHQYSSAESSAIT